jgi:hypothetical protein
MQFIQEKGAVFGGTVADVPKQAVIVGDFTSESGTFLRVDSLNMENNFVCTNCFIKIQ